MPIALPDLHCMLMVEAAGMVDRRVVVFAHNDARLVDRAILSEKINRVRDHDRVLRALPKDHAWLISAILALIFRNRAAPERSGRTPVFDPKRTSASQPNTMSGTSLGEEPGKDCARAPRHSHGGLMMGGHAGCGREPVDIDQLPRPPLRKRCYAYVVLGGRQLVA